ncbi:hypothetical protein KY284_011132 [Solanum tuberosum]|nr:hypothetical protein KY284_011132 [Solanum tuberosum]
MEEIIFTKIYHDGPRGYLTNVGGEGVDVDLGEEGELVNLGGEGEVVDLSGESEAVNLGGEGVDVNIGEEGVDDNLGGEGESDFLSSDSDLDIPSEDGSDIDEEGVDIPARRRSKKVRYDEDCEVSIFELGMVFEGANQFRKAVADYVVEYMRQIKDLGDFIVKNYEGNFQEKESQETIQFCLICCATGGNRRPATSFGVYSDPTTGAQVFNPGTSSEKILHGPTKLKSASPSNIYIDFKPRGLKWKGKDVVGTSQLQQMKANRKNWK